VVSRHDNNMPTGGRGHSAQKTIIDFLGAIARSAGVENVARHQQSMDLIPLNRVGQPRQKLLELLVTLFGVEGSTDMPIGGVQDLHIGFPFRTIHCCDENFHASLYCFRAFSCSA
jgi:hypothetical protein